MITPRRPADSAAVARHYDELGALYRRLWGEHLHHGLWDETNAGASVEEAAERLLEVAIAPLGLRAKQAVVDVGCGYGATARWIARRTGAAVTGVTISPEQVAVAFERPAPTRGSVEIVPGDWLENSFPDCCFGAAVAIESLSHMPDKGAFFRELARTLRPGARAAVVDWWCARDLSPLERLLLRKLCRDGRLPGLGTFAEYSGLITAAGLRCIAHRDLTREAERTWRVIAHRAVTRGWRRPAVVAIMASELCRRPRYLLTLPAVVLAFRTGALRYGAIWIERVS